MKVGEVLAAIFGVACTLEGIDAASLKRSHQVRVHQWVSENCTGFPSHKTVHIRKNKCKKLEAHSVNFHVPIHGQHSKWLNGVAARESECFVTLYDNSGCNEHSGYSIRYSLPTDLEQCLSHPPGIKAAKFWCVPTVRTTTRTHKTFYEETHYAYNSAHPSPHLTTKLKEKNATVVEVYRVVPTEPARSGYTRHEKRHHDKTHADGHHVKPTPAAGHHHSDSDSDSDSDKHDKPKKWGRGGNFWYKDPWGGKPLCFECWGKKHQKVKFECKASSKRPHNCPPLPRESVTVTHYPPYAFVDETVLPVPHPTAEPDDLVVEEHVVQGTLKDSREPQALEARREYERVSMKHPFFDKQVCAKLKWKHPGDGKSTITFKGPIHGCRKHHKNLDLAISPYTITRTAPRSTVTRAVMAHDMTVEEDIETVTIYQ